MPKCLEQVQSVQSYYRNIQSIKDKINVELDIDNLNVPKV